MQKKSCSYKFRPFSKLAKKNYWDFLRINYDCWAIKKNEFLGKSTGNFFIKVAVMLVMAGIVHCRFTLVHRNLNNYALV